MLVPMVILAASSTARWSLAKLFRLIHHSSFRGFPEVNIEEVTFSLLSMAKKEVQHFINSKYKIREYAFIRPRQLQHFQETEEDSPSSARRGVAAFP